ncbi:hypothetical protein CLV98_112115, partial [Dyadobacter jejuensis]
CTFAHVFNFLSCNSKLDWGGWLSKIITRFIFLPDTSGNYSKSLDGLLLRVVAKVNAVAVLQFLNFKNNRPINLLKTALFI